MKKIKILRQKHPFLKYLSIFILGVTSVIFTFAYTTIETDLDNAVQYIQKIVLTNNLGNTGVFLDGQNKNINMYGGYSQFFNNDGELKGKVGIEGNTGFGLIGPFGTDIAIQSGDVFTYGGGEIIIEPHCTAQELLDCIAGDDEDYSDCIEDCEGSLTTIEGDLKTLSIESNGLIYAKDGLSVSGDLMLNDNLSVGGETDLDDDVRIGGRLEVENNLEAKQNLDVNGTAEIENGLHVLGESKFTSANLDNGIGLYSDSTDDELSKVYGRGNGLSWELGNSYGSEGILSLGTTTNRSMRFFVNNNEAMLIDNNGNITVGTNVTGARFDVNGHIEANSIASNENIRASSYSVDTGSGTVQNGIDFTAHYTGTGDTCRTLEFKGGILVGEGNC
ncbi:MAG TPA: hypothetical protein VJ892_03495 [Candidatus Absconditabacterales bacterium]|nr:hypothetical protein [Candidatus Absconditabacterales bacterium]